ncbi:hypothetical protein [Chryseobacterium rhizosphaerae]|uniref:HNH endonuclease n=1 Tax=Chryseobacterium rhizosphaerae TaxID=395937 RepID=A0AAE4C512_9FLAO|nr:hypothetical protein [Chryseobacterium rhizosphaerae]MDR6527210.1 hypothetical protein [Chryseobacterium rhizosphaerae]
MIRIDTSPLDNIKNDYIKLVKKYFNYNVSKKNKKKQIINKDKLINIFQNSNTMESKMLKYFHINLEKIITAKPEDLENQNKLFLKRINYNKNDKVHIAQFDFFKARMINYYKYFFQEKFIHKGEEINYGRWLSKIMGVNVCPYCNHNYIFTLNDNDNKVYTKPEFDHFYSKSDFPLLSLSLYNLVPSCSVCNKIKLKKEISFFPYRENCKETLKFIIDSEGDENPHQWVTGEGKINLKIKHTFDGINETSDLKDTIILQLGIDKIYSEHLDYVEELLDKVYAYNKDYYTSMIDSYNGLNKTPQQIETIIWGAYLEENKKRPLSKLTADILDQLKIKRIE